MNPVLNSEIAVKHSALAALCARYGVASLDLFGSGTTDDWRPSDSDLDFIVAFKPDANRSLADRYLGLATELEALFERSVDLLTEGAIRNPYFREQVTANRTRVYAE